MFRAGHIIYGETPIEEIVIVFSAWIAEYRPTELEGALKKAAIAVNLGHSLDYATARDIVPELVGRMAGIAPPYLSFRKEGDGFGFFPSEEAWDLPEKGERYTAVMRDGDPVEVRYGGEVVWTMLDKTIEEAALSAAERMSK